MGGAIDMEKDIDMLKREVEKLNNIIRGMMHELDEVAEEMEDMAEKSTKTKHVDLVDDVKVEEDKKHGKKKADTKGNGKSNKSSDTADGSNDTKSK